MSDIKLKFSEAYISPFDETLFRREDDVLNVFRSTTQKEMSDGMNGITEMGTFLDSSYSKSPNSLFNYQNEQIDIVKGSKGNLEVSRRSEDEFWSESLIPIKVLCEKAEGESEETTGIHNSRSSPAAPLINQTHHSAPEFFYHSTPEKLQSDLEEISDSVSQTPLKRKNLFSKRKDVIIKTLLRKWKKFFVKDFNSQTSYLKTAKRKFGSSVYRSTLETYITQVLQIPFTEDMLIFLGVFLYPRDLEDNLDFFVSPNFPPLAIKSLMMRVHEILYQYSHKKFHTFSKNSEFKFLFTYFEKAGISEIQKHIPDQEYARGLDIILGQR